ncbi:MAG TPA: quinone oxidoreductase [Actinomycetota bacterium]|nr:quinone oxidoreductase [Actinomycetota bacterium]
MRAIVVREQGPPEVLVLEDLDDPRPGPGQALVRLAAAGVNMIDVQQRSGGYRIDPPFTPGTEAAGEVVEVHGSVDGIAPGNRVAYAGVRGAYAELAVVPAERLVPVPDGVPTELAAAGLLQGMTAHYLVHAVVPLHEGDVVVVHAAAGGVGLLLTQLAAATGLRVIGTTSTEEKAELVRKAGALDVVVRGDRAFPAVVEEHTDGRGARAVFDSIGRDTFDDSLASLARRGTVVLFGQSSGPVAPFDLARLQAAGSVFVTRPGLADYVATREELLGRAGAVLSMIGDGSLEVRVHARFPLERADDAHRALQSRATAGKVLLTIDRSPS